MPVEIDVPNPKGVLRPNMSIQANLHLAKVAHRLHNSSVVLVRDSYLRVRAGFTLSGMARRTGQRFELGESREDEGKVEILAGVKATDRIVINPKGLSGDVVPVEVKPAP